MLILLLEIIQRNSIAVSSIIIINKLLAHCTSILSGIFSNNYYFMYDCSLPQLNKQNLVV